MYNLRKRTVISYAEDDFAEYDMCEYCKESYVEQVLYYPEFSNYEILLEQLFEFISDDNFYLKYLFCETEKTIYDELDGLVFA